MADFWPLEARKSFSLTKLLRDWRLKDLFDLVPSAKLTRTGWVPWSNIEMGSLPVEYIHTAKLFNLKFFLHSPALPVARYGRTYVQYNTVRRMYLYYASTQTNYSPASFIGSIQSPLQLQQPSLPPQLPLAFIIGSLRHLGLGRYYLP